MSTTVVSPSRPAFFAHDGRLWLGADAKYYATAALNTAALLRKGGKIGQFDQSPGPQPGSILLGVVVEHEDLHEVFTAIVSDVQPAPGAIVPPRFRRVLASAAPISKITATKDGVFVSAEDGAFYYSDAQGPAPEVHTLLAAAPVGATAVAAASGPMADIVAAKDGIATFLSNLIDALPNIAGAVEHRVGQELLDAFGADIKAQQANLGSVFNQPLASLIQKGPQAPPNNAMAAALSASPQESSDQAVRRLFTSKLELNRYLNPYSFRGAIAPGALSADIPPAGLAADAGDGSDPMEELGKLFKPLTLTLDAKNVASLLGTGIEDLLEAISGAKPISEVLNDMFNIFKLDEAMKTLGSILSGGQISTLVAKIPLKEYLSNPIDNAFFAGLYKHYFPDKTFNALDFTAFMGALFGYVAFAAQGKSDAFHSVFSDQQSLSELTSTPSKWVQAISGAATPAPVAMSAAPAEGLELRAAPPQPPRPSAGDPPSWVGPVAIVSAGLMTLLVGAFGAVSFGTGLIASPMTAGVAAGGFQALGGIAQNGDTRDVKWDLLGGFVGGFTGAFLATVFGNKLFAGWARRGDTPTARIQKLKLIMGGFTLTLGGGGGAIISSLLKNYAKSKKLVFDDALALTCGAVGGLGGGAMGCGLHFMGGISGSSCLPVELSLLEANQIQLSAITPAAPVMNNAAPMPAQNPAFPPLLGANPNVAMGVYKNEFNQPGVLPPGGKSIAFVKWSEFTLMDQGDPTPPPTPGYNGQREKLFWLEAGAGGLAPAANRRADLVIGVHGVGRYVFPCISHQNPTGGDHVDFTRPMFETDFASYLAADPWITGFLGGLGRRGIIKLAVCFSALPLGICSLSQELATRLNATVYGGRPPVIPWLSTTGNPQVPRFGGWVKYDP